MTIEDALEYCLANPDGLGVEELLAKFPEYRAELQPLLALSSQIVGVTPPPVPAERQAAMKARLMEAAAAQSQAARSQPRQVGERVVVVKQREQNWVWAVLRRPLFVAATFAVLVVALLWWGAASALPNSPLYGVKLASENILLNFSGSAADKANAHLGLANNRLDDIEAMERQGNLAGIDGAVGNYNDHVKSSATLWKQTTGAVQQAIKAEISTAISRCERDFKSFNGDVAALPAPLKSEVQRLYNDLSTVRAEIGESPGIEAPVGITVTIAPSATPSGAVTPGTPTATVVERGTATQVIAAGTGTPTGGAGATETVTETPADEASATVEPAGTQIATTEPTLETVVATLTRTPKVVSTAVAKKSSTPARVTETPRVGLTTPGTVTSTYTATYTATPSPTATSTVTKMPVSGVMPSPTRNIRATATPEDDPPPVPPLPVIYPTQTTEPIHTALPVPTRRASPSPAPEPTSDECKLHLEDVQLQTSCVVDGSVSWVGRIQNDDSSPQKGEWEAVLYIKGRSGGYQETARMSGSGTFAPHTSIQVAGTFPHAILANTKSVKVELSVNGDGQRCGDSTEKEKECDN